MNSRGAFLLLSAALLSGCVSTHREIPFTHPDFGRGRKISQAIPIRLGSVQVGEGGLFLPAVYWKPSFWRVLPLPENRFRSKVVRLIRRELDRAGFAEDAEEPYSLDVKIEKLALFTRGDEHLGYRQGYARLEFKLRSGEEDKFSFTEEGEAKFPGSHVRRSSGGGFLGHFYVYEREDPKPLDYAVRFAVRAFLEDLAPHLP